jgi:hypothetical protein
VGRFVFLPFLLGRSCFKLDIVEALFIEAASDACVLSNSCGWEAILEVWEDMWLERYCFLPTLVIRYQEGLWMRLETCVSVPGTDNWRKRCILTRLLVEMSHSG